MLHNEFLQTAGLVVALTISVSTASLAQTGEAFIYQFDEFPSASSWYASDFAMKRESFRTNWNPENLSLTEDRALQLGLWPTADADGTPDLGAGALKHFQGAELQRKEKTHFGTYEVVMTAARGDGLISAFFTYTGPYFKDPHDEIDFEFLGRDTTKVWLTRFVDGENLPGRWIDLGFDAADARHIYTLEWLPDRLVWYADQRELMRVTEDEAPIPQTAQRIYFSIWAGGPAQSDWSGNAPDDARGRARVYCVSYRPAGQETSPMCSDEPLPDRIE
ncbi:family 16 glycosylhydrolase [Poseidonocella sp. HB161398]|uniref:family 16 glycosylhydrolase n=1 Tax=Poseidonocella sp. HB161398 TaxID=2320855 RepID=UPI0011099F25|nr:family 16 glycosylhydrolase [Poseidonocella sp. HB161398]